MINVVRGYAPRHQLDHPMCSGTHTSRPVGRLPTEEVKRSCEPALPLLNDAHSTPGADIRGSPLRLPRPLGRRAHGAGRTRTELFRLDWPAQTGQFRLPTLSFTHGRAAWGHLRVGGTR